MNLLKLRLAGLGRIQDDKCRADSECTLQLPGQQDGMVADAATLGLQLGDYLNQ
jgi:hypothetical protein